MNYYVTNNPMVVEKKNGKFHADQLEFHDTDYLSILKTVRDKIHLGHRLISHPLSGSIKPGQTPYKTIVLTSEKGGLHEESLHIIEESISTCLKLTKDLKVKDWHESVLLDFQLIDYDLIFN